MLLKLSSAKWRPFCPGGDELNAVPVWDPSLVVTVPADGLAPTGARPSSRHSIDYNVSHTFPRMQ